MSQGTYGSMIESLRGVGLIGQQNRPDQLIVSTQHGPVWPNRGNSFWLSHQSGTWFLSTWAPRHYRIPGGQDVVALCLACMESSTSAMYRVPGEIAARFGLELISYAEFERLFPVDGDDEA